MEYTMIDILDCLTESTSDTIYNDEVERIKKLTLINLERDITKLLNLVNEVGFVTSEHKSEWLSLKKRYNKLYNDVKKIKSEDRIKYIQDEYDSLDKDLSKLALNVVKMKKDKKRKEDV